MKPVVVGILSKDDIRKRVLAIARGELKPRPQDPKIWFNSMRSLAEVLSDENCALLRLIQEAKPREARSDACREGDSVSNSGVAIAAGPIKD